MSQPLIPRFTLICDEVRREDNGKLLIIGLYTPDISVPQIPFVFPSLTIVQGLESSSIGQFPFRSTLQILESGTTLAQAIGAIEIQKPGFVMNVLRFGNLKIQHVGVYMFTSTYEGISEPLTHSFQVLLPS